MLQRISGHVGGAGRRAGVEEGQQRPVLSASKAPQLLGAGDFAYYTNYSVFLLHQFSRSVVSDSFQPHELQHARPPCSSPTPGTYPNPCPLS